MFEARPWGQGEVHIEGHHQISAALWLVPRKGEACVCVCVPNVRVLLLLLLSGIRCG